MINENGNSPDAVFQDIAANYRLGSDSGRSRWQDDLPWRITSGHLQIEEMLHPSGWLRITLLTYEAQKRQLSV